MKAKAPLTSNHMTPGIMISLDKRIYRVESTVKVTVPKGPLFIKTKLKDLLTQEVIEKNFKEGQVIDEVYLEEHTLEFLYGEGKDYLFLDVSTLENVLVPKEIIKDKINFIKEGIEVKAMFYANQIFSVELPQFLELMVVKAEGAAVSQVSNSTKTAVLETGAHIEVPLFIETGDIVKVDTTTNEFIQRL